MQPAPCAHTRSGVSALLSRPAVYTFRNKPRGPVRLETREFIKEITTALIRQRSFFLSFFFLFFLSFRRVAAPGPRFAGNKAEKEKRNGSGGGGGEESRIS